MKEEKRDLVVIGTGRTEKTLENIERLGATATRDNREACRRADIVILSVKPFNLPSVVEIAEEIREKTVLSVVAGVRTDFLESMFPGARVIRAMPNIDALAKASVTALSAGKSARDEDKTLAEDIFRTIGDVIWIPEEQMDPFTALIGSGPGLIAELIDALVLGAVAAGMPRDLAYATMLKLLEGTARTLEVTGMHPAQLRDLVATPAGTTIKGIYMMELRAVKAALMEAVQKAAERSHELGMELSHFLQENTKTSIISS